MRVLDAPREHLCLVEEERGAAALSVAARGGAVEDGFEREGARDAVGLADPPGADLPLERATFVVVDLEIEKVVRAEDLQGMSDFSPFEGKTLKGWPVATIKAGKIIARDGKIVCFFQSAQKFKTRYATLGFMHEANLDEGAMWPTAFALKELTAAEEAKVGALVKKAVG